MAHNQNPEHDDPRDREENGMNEYGRITDEWNHGIQVRDRRRQRSEMINNTDGYRTGYRVHHIRSIQMPSYEIWDQLFGNEIIHPALREYVGASLEWVQRETNTVRFAGQMEVSLLMQENYRPGVHVAIFIIHLIPHRHFHDGHMIQMEFCEGSHTHQTVTRIFDVNSSVLVQQATEYQILGYLADDDEAMNLLHTCFLQPDFAPMRFSFVEPQLNYEEGDDEDEGDDYGYYIVNQENAIDNHMWHDIADAYNELHAAAAPADAVIAIPPPPPIHDLAAIYRENFGFENDEDDAADVWAADAYAYANAYANAYAQNNINEYNYYNNQYIPNQNADADDDDADDDLPARG
jgi:hypothetical protein